MKNFPLFSVDPSCVIPDALLMQIRIVNRLTEGLLAGGKMSWPQREMENPDVKSLQLIKL